jgi:quercetin dioxygenase-like cupin family protein
MMKRQYLLAFGGAAAVVVLLAAGLAVLRVRLLPGAAPATERQVLSQTLPTGLVQMRWYWFEVIQPAREPQIGFQPLGTGFVLPVVGNEAVDTALRERNSVGEGNAFFFTGTTPGAISYLPGRNGLRALHGFFSADASAAAPPAGPMPDVEGTLRAAEPATGPHVVTVRSVTVPPHGATALRRHPGASLLLKIEGEVTVVLGAETQPLSRYRGLAESFVIVANRQYQVRNPADVPAAYILVNLTPLGAAVDAG